MVDLGPSCHHNHDSCDSITITSLRPTKPRARCSGRRLYSSTTSSSLTSASPTPSGPISATDTESERGASPRMVNLSAVCSPLKTTLPTLVRVLGYCTIRQQQQRYITALFQNPCFPKAQAGRCDGNFMPVGTEKSIHGRLSSCSSFTTSP